MRKESARIKEKEMECVWCLNPNSDYEPADPEKELCRSHLAEWEGLSEAELDRMESEQAKDFE